MRYFVVFFMIFDRQIGDMWDDASRRDLIWIFYRRKKIFWHLFCQVCERFSSSLLFFGGGDEETHISRWKISLDKQTRKQRTLYKNRTDERQLIEHTKMMLNPFHFKSQISLPPSTLHGYLYLLSPCILISGGN